jgi:Domain of unknown function (DUF1998)
MLIPGTQCLRRWEWSSAARTVSCSQNLRNVLYRLGISYAWAGARRWRKNNGYPTVHSVLLHSLAHALLRQFSLECGYTTASIRERIYSRPPMDDAEPMAGILLYTAAPDSEGTLGGLVSLGEPQTLGQHLDQALEAMRLCTSDPLCAEHPPSGDSLTLHGAACHPAPGRTGGSAGGRPPGG